MKPFLLVSITFIVAGCATSEVTPEQTAPIANTIGVGDSITTVAAEESTLAAQKPASFTAEDVVSDSAGTIESLEAPQVTQTPAEEIPGIVLPEEALECEQTTRPGSVLPVRVCRDKRVVDARRAADQELIHNIKRNTALFASRL